MARRRAFHYFLRQLFGVHFQLVVPVRAFRFKRRGIFHARFPVNDYRRRNVYRNVVVLFNPVLVDFKVQLERKAAPAIDEHGHADFHETNLIESVAAGQVLAQRATRVGENS